MVEIVEAREQLRRRDPEGGEEVIGESPLQGAGRVMIGEHDAGRLEKLRH